MLIKTKEGVEVNVEKEVFDDFETLDILVEANDGDPLALSKLCSKLFTKEDKKKLYDAYRSKDGRVTFETFIPVITDIMNSLGKSEKN